MQDKGQKVALISYIRTKMSRLAFLANVLSTSSGVAQCWRWHCSQRRASSRSSVIRWTSAFAAT